MNCSKEVKLNSTDGQKEGHKDRQAGRQTDKSNNTNNKFYKELLIYLFIFPVYITSLCLIFLNRIINY